MEPRDLEVFCRRLGSILADFPHTVLVESDDSRTADRLIVDGILASYPQVKAKISVYHRTLRNSTPPFAGEQARFVDLFFPEPVSLERVSPSHLQMLRESQLVIVVGGGSNSYTVGLAASLMGIRLIPVAAFGGAGRLLWQQLRDSFGSSIAKLPSRYTWDRLNSAPQTVLDAIRQEIAALPRIMIVHGRDSDRALVKEILSAQGVADPIVLREQFTPGDSIMEKLEREARQADGALVLATPDDEAAARLDPSGAPMSVSNLRKRARQNVILEYGWFWGKLGRKRVLLLLKGELELPTDLAGLLYASYFHDPGECQQDIAAFIDALR
jgi:predicted nucleotide-binding protein